jgi:hypothetical protein
MLTSLASLGMAGAAQAADIVVNTNITTSTTWTANNVYNLTAQVYVEPGATLTIEAGTVIASNLGSLAVVRGGDIIIQGTKENPVVMTSVQDRATWTNDDPQTASWRQVANEWGNLTIMGEGYISTCLAGNVAFPDAGNESDMEGLTTGPAFDRYGGGNDDDDSGSIKYLQLRYTGKVIGLGNELNGLALGGVGRGTDIQFIENMNGVDDGIEIWGGTVGIKNFVIWNAGDDSFDVDQGWRGKAQFGLIVQGASTSAAQGSGIGDNAFEVDGAEPADYQPVTTAAIYNCTVVGVPNGFINPNTLVAGAGADHGTAWRDNARVQYRNMVFMDLGERLVGFDNVGDTCLAAGAGVGYGVGGTLSWANTWTTDYNAVPAHPNDFPGGAPAGFYGAQTSGKLAEIKDSVFFNNTNGSAYTEAVARGVLGAGNTPANDNLVATNSPIKFGPVRDVSANYVVNGTLVIANTIELDPRAANDATTSVGQAPNDGFFTPAGYRGAFNASENWALNWTAADAFGFFKKTIEVNSNITTSTTWTKDYVYNLTSQVYVEPGATLTIEAGTVIASDQGSLAVTRGGDIIINGTQAEPVIMTSDEDRKTWICDDPKTSQWRQVANEWGNLTIMGEGYISTCLAGNVAFPDAGNESDMEGLTTGPAFDRYGGGNDDDDSGSIKYLSLRYTGKVIGLGNELNGLALGGVGRGTDIQFIENMNGVDDGIEIWGGTVGVKNFVIWNAGDDSFDCDQGWRGKAQFGFIVQGASTSAAQGSGIGDNAFEIDGAEPADYQPVTTAAIYNCTVVGVPNGFVNPNTLVAGAGSDHGTAWRDNARVQYRNMVFMDLGERLVGFDNVGDTCLAAGAGVGYGVGGTLSWANTWTTAYNAVPAHPNDFPGGAPVGFYGAQTSGNLAEIKDSVFFNNTNGAAYTEAIARGVLGAGATPAMDNLVATNSPIRSAPVRASSANYILNGSLVIANTISIDPRAANDAVTSVASAPNDGFFTPAGYRGAFNSVDNWLCRWSAADCYGFLKVASSDVVNSALNLQNTISAVGLPTLPNPAFAVSLNSPGTCGVTPGSVALVFPSLGSPLPLPWPDGGCTGGPSTLIANLFTAQTGLLKFFPWFGAPIPFPYPLPNRPELCGAHVTFQSAFFTAGLFEFRLGAALDCTLGVN